VTDQDKEPLRSFAHKESGDFTLPRLRKPPSNAFVRRLYGFDERTATGLEQTVKLCKLPLM
jgi:hypothetical protein